MSKPFLAYPLAFKLMSAMRGPDSLSEDAVHWKSFVIAPLRWLVAEGLGVNPYTWCDGAVASPEDALSGIEMSPADVAQARRFTKEEEDAYKHAGYHAASAFTYLLEVTESRQVIVELTDVLVREGLIPFVGDIGFSVARWLGE